jgi:chromosome segregation ATPase
MQRALDDANAKVDSLAAELASFQIKYSKLKENNSKLEIWYNSLKSQCAQLENELYNLNHIKSEQKELRRVIFQLNQEIDNARKKYESCNNAWSNKYYTVEKECEKWKREYEEMKEECKVAGKCFTKSQAAIFLKAIGFLEEKLHDNDSWKVPDNKTVGKIANNIFGYSAEKSRQSLSQTNAADVTVIKNALKNKYPILEKCLK